MSMSKLEEICCPCGESFEAELWNTINAADDPDLREALLCGEINIVCCPKCNQLFHAEHFLLYHDPAAELLAFVYPRSFEGEADRWRRKMEDDFARAVAGFEPGQRISYDPLLVFGLDAMVSMIRDDEEISDEAAILQYAARDIGVTLLKLHRSQARLRRLPYLLPLVKKAGSSQRAQVREGLIRLLEYNENLVHYRDILKMIENDSEWCVESKLIEK